MQDGGVPAVGDFDFEFRLFVDPIGQAQVGSFIALEDIPLTAGRFTVKLDFADGVFNGDQRWLEKSVRPGVSTNPGDFVILNPLQNITTVPYAQYALNGSSDGSDHSHSSLDAADVNPVDALRVDNNGEVGIGIASPQAKLHVEATGGTTLNVSDNLYVDTSSSFVSVNRTDRVTIFEYFGVHAPESSGWGGMYVTTEGAKPFYGYKTDTKLAGPTWIKIPATGT